MRKRIGTKTVTQLAGVALIAFALKLFYSTAGVNDLTWVLSPTAFFVELTTAETFRFESGAGYMNADNSFLIAAPCSGVNFLITAFLLLAFGKLWKCRHTGIRWASIPVFFAVAYLTTIVANTTRIAVSLRRLRMEPADTVWANPEQLHRFEGIFVYFGFLLLLFILSEHADRDALSRRRDLLKGAWLPLLIYWATTLGIPILNGAYQQGSDFWEHFAFVIITPFILILPLFILRTVKRAPRRYA